MFKMLTEGCNFFDRIEMSTNTGKISSESELACQYNWYSETFAHKIKEVAEDFFDKNFNIHLLGICKNINALAGKEAYFVTKIKIDKQHDVFFRLSDMAVKVILDKVLGHSTKKFDIEKLTDFETKLLTTFNSVMFRNISENFLETPPVLTRKNFNVIYLVFVVVDNENKISGRFTVALPEILINAEKIENDTEYPTDIFEKSLISVRLDVGKTTFTLHELKNLEEGDTVVFENSEAGKLYLKYMDYEKEVYLEENSSIVVPYGINGGNVMAGENINIWDSIEVEMNAHFDAVNITLGELKKIHAGKVIELASVYQNQVTLTVEDKTIAKGELVIINDKYGVKITDVVVPTITPDTVQQAVEPVVADDNSISDNEISEIGETEVPTVEQEVITEDDELDYSDFDLEEDI